MILADSLVRCSLLWSCLSLSPMWLCSMVQLWIPHLLIWGHMTLLQLAESNWERHRTERMVMEKWIQDRNISPDASVPVVSHTAELKQSNEPSYFFVYFWVTAWSQHLKCHSATSVDLIKRELWTWSTTGIKTSQLKVDFSFQRAAEPVPPPLR